MALDGITIAAVVHELNQTIADGRIYKIAQPENDELLLTIKHPNGQQRLLISAGASLPFVYLTQDNKPSPMTAPNFCMLLRKHIQNGRIISITQPGLERIVRIGIEHLNDMGDLCQKTLVIELMGKHSNIIFLDDKEMVIDSIKHISGLVSSVREVLPGRDYFIPETQDKMNPLILTSEVQSKTNHQALPADTIRHNLTDDNQTIFLSHIKNKPMPLSKALYTTFTGISPMTAEEICFRASVDSALPANTLDEDTLLHVFHHFVWLLDDVKACCFTPNIVYSHTKNRNDLSLEHADASMMPIEFSAIKLQQYADLPCMEDASVSRILETYYAKRNVVTRIRQKSVDLRKIAQTALERNVKKYELQLKQLRDTEKKDKYKVYGELINTYGYGLEPGCKSFEALNYYTNENITIPLDPLLTPAENAKKYFDKYNKLKRTDEALSTLIKETKDEVAHLESILTSMDIALQEEDLSQIKEELVESGYIKRKGRGNAKKERVKSKPFHYISSDGYHIYVGKNNYQNEELTFKFATGGDWWFHAKGIPGSHVILKSDNEKDIPIRTFEEAGKLAAYYSKGRGQEKVEIDYTEKKNVKKPGGGKPGFVVYYTNYSLMIDSDISGIKESD